MSVDYSRSFSGDYDEATDRFVAAAIRVGCDIDREVLDVRGPAGQELAIHVARWGHELPRKLVISSGLHGVEGYYGSATQIALLENQLIQQLPPDMGLLLLHGLNPYGFAWNRRWNESNVDLNRNFIPEFERYEGCHPLYRKLDGFLNPKSVPSIPNYWPLAVWNIARYGFGALREALPIGQYEFPKGLFYGGSGPEQTYRILKQRLVQWLGNPQQVFHFDLHTGLGRHGQCDVLIQAEAGSERVLRLHEIFGREHVKANPYQDGDAAEQTFYVSNGTFEKWCLDRLECDYEFVTIECGTYPGATVLGRLRAENAAYHASGGKLSADAPVKRRLIEAFAPASPKWRQLVVQRTIDHVHKSLAYKF